MVIEIVRIHLADTVVAVIGHYCNGELCDD